MLHDAYTVEKTQQLNRERAPERVVHAEGSGAHGRFEVTGDVTRHTRADLFSEVGERAEVFARSSQVAGESGYADTPRGSSVRFQSSIRSQKRLPDSGLRSEDMSSSPRSTPRTWCRGSG